MINYDLAMMALEGLTRSPLSIRPSGKEIVIEGSAEAFRNFARLCLLLGGEGSESRDGFELQEGVHSTRDSVALTIRRP